MLQRISLWNRSFCPSDSGDHACMRKRAEEIIALTEKTECELRADIMKISGEVSIGGNPTVSVLNVAAAVHREYTDIRFRFYSSDATDVTERLDHGSLDFAVLLEPVDTTKYEYFSLSDSAHWGLLMPESCALAKKAAVEKEDILNIPLILHHRIGLQQEIVHWAQREIGQLHIAATYNVISGNSAAFVQSGMGYLLTTDEHLLQQLVPGLCFRPLLPTMELHYVLVWKRYAVFSKAAEVHLEKAI